MSFHFIEVSDMLCEGKASKTNAGGAHPFGH